MPKEVKAKLKFTDRKCIITEPEIDFRSFMEKTKVVPTSGCLHSHKSNGKAVVDRGPPVSVSSRVSLHEYRKMTSLSPIGPAEFADVLSVQQLSKQESFMSILSQRLPSIKVSNRSLMQSMVASPGELRLAG